LQLPNNNWKTALQGELDKPYFQKLQQFIEAEYEQCTVFPKYDQLFTALQLTDINDTKVVILGQDPYHGAGQAYGLAFSVQEDCPPPPSLRNIMKELEDDLQLPPSKIVQLDTWAKQGVLLLNTVLSVRKGQAGSHQKQGWEQFTDRIISLLSEKAEPIIFILWGKPAQAKKKLIAPHHILLESVHPSPLSSYRGFFGSKPFSKTNKQLIQLGHQPIDWSLS